ncbi:MAG: GntR family transcriptional regulator [Microbacteriaceae bacterium]
MIPPAKSTMANRLQAELLRLIAELGLKPGDKLPTEAELAAHFSVGRSTTREALKYLEEQGLVHAVRGQGRFLSAVGSLSIERPVTRYESTTEMLESLGYRVTSAVLQVEESVAGPRQAVALDITEGSPVIRLTRMRYGDDKPMVFSICVMPRNVLPGPIEHRDWGTPLNAALEAHGQRIASSAARITAVNLPESLETRFKLAGLGPWLLAEETCISESGLRVLYAEDYHRGSEIGFNVLRRR